MHPNRCERRAAVVDCRLEQLGEIDRRFPENTRLELVADVIEAAAQPVDYGPCVEPPLEGAGREVRIAEKAQKLGIERVAFDRSGFKFHGRVKALAEAAREGGLKF